MKMMPFFSLLLLMCHTLSAQETTLPLDERGKLIYYEVVEQKDLAATVLEERAMHFFKTAKDVQLLKGNPDTLWTAKGKMILNKTALVLSRPSGEVSYNLYLDFKAGKYRFWLTDFVFTPYQRDRYGNFVPSTSIGTPLEKNPGKLNAGEWEAYTRATAREAQLFAARFRKSMAAAANNSPSAKAVPVISTKDKKW